MGYSVVVPTFGKPELLENCLSTMRQFNGGAYEIIVSDDGSSDHEKIDFMAKKYSAKFYYRSENKGFAFNVNYGISKTTSDFVFVVNSDIQFTEPVFDLMEKYMKTDQKIGVCGLRLMYPDGKVQHAGQFKHGPDFGHVGRGEKIIDNNRLKQNFFPISVTGAFHLVRKSAWDKIKYDDSFYLANEDVRFCLSMWESGYKVFCVCQASAIHLEGATRGADEEGKLSFNPETYFMEIEGGERFRDEIKHVDFQKVYDNIWGANSKGIDSALTVERIGATGDTIYTTGIIREIFKINGVEKVYVKTMCHEVFRNSPYVEMASWDVISSSGRVLYLTNAYEKRPNMGIIESYAEVAGLDPKNCLPEIHATGRDQVSLLAKLDTVGAYPYVVIHQGLVMNWINKMLPAHVYGRIISSFVKLGYRVAVVGSDNDVTPLRMNGVINLVGKLNLQELYVLIKGARYFFVPDSGVLAVAQCTDTPGSAFFCAADPKHILVKPNILPIVPEIDCVGCLHRQKPPVNYCHCPDNRDFECTKKLTFDYIWGKIKEHVNGIR